MTDAKICISITSIDSSSASLSPYHTFFSMPAAYRAYLGLCHRSRLAPKFAFPSALWGPSLPAVSKSKAKQSKQSRQAEAVTQYAQHSLPNPYLDLLHPKRLQATSTINISKLQRHVHPPPSPQPPASQVFLQLYKAPDVFCKAVIKFFRK